MRAPFDLLKRVGAWALTGATLLSGYGLAKLEPYGAPILLPLSEWDKAIPLIPWTIWIYGSESMVGLLGWLLVPDALWGRRLYFTLALASAVCWLFFAFYPTTYPRELWPLPEGTSATLLEFADLRATDTPSNCFPSLHVALAWGGALVWGAWMREQKSWYWWLPFVWALAVCFCTLTTKQHYLVDIPSGMVVAWASWGLVRWGVTPEASAAGKCGLSEGFKRESDLSAIRAMRERVEGHQWKLREVLPEGSLKGEILPERMVRLVSEVIWIEEIAGLNFRFQAEAFKDPELKALYRLFAEEERRHADALRQLLKERGAIPRFPGLGNALVLDQFDTLDPLSQADQLLVAISTPVFETFLDAGTIPFLQSHPDLKNPAFDAVIEHICQDEAQHLALNWKYSREAARKLSFLAGLRLLLNFNIYRGMLAVPWMSLEVYALAASLGYDFKTLLPAFSKLWRLHHRYPEFAWYPPWWMYRLFVICGAIATWVCIGLSRAGLLFPRLWTSFTLGLGLLSKMLFGQRLLTRRFA